PDRTRLPTPGPAPGWRPDRPTSRRADNGAASPVLGAAPAAVARVGAAPGLVAVQVPVLLLEPLLLLARLGPLLLEPFLALLLLALRLALLVPALGTLAGRLGLLVAVRPLALLRVTTVGLGLGVPRLLLLVLQALRRGGVLLLLLGRPLGLPAVGPAANLLGRRVLALRVLVPVLDVLAQLRGVRLLAAVPVRV